MTDTATSSRTVEGVVVPAPGVYDLDLSHSLVSFSVRHLMVSRTRGRFARFSGVVNVAEDPAGSNVEVSIEVASLETGDAKRDGHLVSPDFFDAEAYPTITFKSTGVTDWSGESFKLVGDLTVHGVTREVVLDARVEGVATSPWGTEAAGFSASTEIDRETFGLTWNQALESGGVLVGKTAKVEIEAELVRRAD